MPANLAELLFGAWWDSLIAAEQESVVASVGLLDRLYDKHLAALKKKG